MGDPMRSRGAVVVVCLLVLTGCGGDDGESRPASAVEEQVEALGREAERSGYDVQASALAGGRVTEAELRTSISGTVECWEDAGLETFGYQRVDVITGFDYEAAFEPGSVPKDQASAVADECEERHRTAVSSAWTLQESTLTPRSLLSMQRCFEAAGLDSGDAESIEDFQRAAGDETDAWVDCMTAASDELRAED
jgi:hypothetical protein